MYAVIVQDCKESQCPSEVLTEVGHGGGWVYLECELGHDETMRVTDLLDLMGE